MTHRVLALALLCVVFSSGCGPRREPRRRPTLLLWRAWPAALATSLDEAAAGRYAAADSVLVRFVTSHPDSPDTLEALFWRATYLVDPANETPAGAQTAVELIDRYLAAQAAERRYEAGLLRRIAVLRAEPRPTRVDTVFAVDTAAVRAAVAREIEAHDKLREEEMTRLRDSLALATAELDRIRRRLAPPPPQRP